MRGLVACGNRSAALQPREFCRVKERYRGTSLIRKCIPLGPYLRLCLGS